MKRYTLIGPDGAPYASTRKGTIGGHRATRIYGRLDCPSARRAIEYGGYVRHRVFFADEPTAVAAGYRPCARCLPNRYREWKLRATKDGMADCASYGRDCTYGRSNLHSRGDNLDHRTANRTH